MHKQTRTHKLNTCTDVAIKQVLPMTHMQDHAHNINKIYEYIYVHMHAYIHAYSMHTSYICAHVLATQVLV